MRKITLTQILMLALTLAGLTTMAQTNYFIDFNHTDATTGNWNNISGVTVGTTVNDLISDAGVAGTFDMAVTDDFVAANNDGTTTPGVALLFHFRAQLLKIHFIYSMEHLIQQVQLLFQV